ncbi:MAG: glycosyltransferase [Planctomycetes bacterium]|nr:glycosyltransferase [Planctomycetota bacterium]
MIGKLTIYEPNREPYTLSLTEGKVLVVGRGPTADIVILDKMASRVHCELWHNGRECFLSDLESLNGTFVNGKKVKRNALEPGDQISIGSTRIEFSLGEEKAETAPSEDVRTLIFRCARCEAVIAQGGRFIRNAVEMGSGIYCAECATHIQLRHKTSGMGRPPMPMTEHPEGSTLVKLPVVSTGQAVPAAPVPSPLRATPTVRGGFLHPDPTVERFLTQHPGQSANVVATHSQKAWYCFLALVFLVLFSHYLYFFHVTHLLCSFYLVVILYKLACVWLSVIRRMDIRVPDEEVRSLKAEDLPVYTILVPLYKEKEVAGKIVKNMKAMDYPQDKLDVKLLLEEDDRATIEACRQAQLPPNFEMVIVPDSKPKTKPKACNHGLGKARGEYLVIYDAEDRPEPDQLKKAVCAFRDHAASKTICLQAKLNYFNPRQNLLTRWFTVEYTTWFDLYLPGLHAMGAPIPLGGTSNHFKTSVLREIGGWDPYNVTEDCDLGIRLYRRGYETEILDSTTWEEANSRVYNWIRQRSRWVKGYLQTHLVHMRRPFRTLWELGPWKFFGFLVSVGGLAVTLLLNPIFWLVVLLYGGLWTTHRIAPDLTVAGYSVKPWQMIYPLTPEYDYFWSMVSIVFFGLTATMFLGNFFFVFTHVLACSRRGLRDLLGCALIMPLYWALISVAAWKGFLQLFFKPFYWEKTIHGLDTQGGQVSPSLASAS